MNASLELERECFGEAMICDTLSRFVPEGLWGEALLIHGLTMRVIPDTVAVFGNPHAQIIAAFAGGAFRAHQDNRRSCRPRVLVYQPQANRMWVRGVRQMRLMNSVTGIAPRRWEAESKAKAGLGCRVEMIYISIGVGVDLFASMLKAVQPLLSVNTHLVFGDVRDSASAPLYKLLKRSGKWTGSVWGGIGLLTRADEDASEVA